MNPEDIPLLSRNAFTEGQMLFDLIYMYPETGIMSEAIAAGAKASNGLGMLLHQGARSFEIWTGKAPNITAMRNALEQAVYK
jgi:shikimate dehydrogenase